MNISLAQDASRLPDLLKKTLDVSVDYLGSIDQRPPATDFVRNDPLDLPDDGLGTEQKNLVSGSYPHTQ